MKITARWLFGTVARVLLMGPLKLVRWDAAVRWLDHRLPGG